MPGISLLQVQRQEGQGGQAPGPENPGRLSHGYRWDNITLIARPSSIHSQERETEGISFERPAERWVSKNLRKRGQADTDS